MLSKYEKTYIKAEKFYHQQNFKKAIPLFEKLLELSPTKNINLLTNLANAYDYIGDKKQAINLYKQALNLAPNSAVIMCNMGGSLYELKQYKEAQKYLKKSLEINPINSYAHLNLGNVYDAIGEKKLACKHYNEAIKYKNDYSLAYCNMGNILYELEKYDEAIKYCKKAISLDNKDTSSYLTLGNIFDTKEDFRQAIFYYKECLKLDSNYVLAYNNIASVYEKIGDNKNAEICFWKTLLLDGDNNENHLNYGYLLYDIIVNEDKQIAHNHCKKWLKKFPNNPIVKHMTSSIYNDKKITNSAREYVEGLFDSFASDFDDSLSQIDYKAPFYIGDKIKDIYIKTTDNKLAILDAGCGTGLCGKYIKNTLKNAHLIGVDLSSNMLKEAKKKSYYDNLIHQDLLEYLDNNKNHFDLITSADVLTYFGGLEELIKSFYESIKSGYLLLTITKNNTNNNDFYLHPSGRFRHSQKYLDNLLKEHGFTDIRSEEVILRYEADEEVVGFIYSAKK